MKPIKTYEKVIREIVTFKYLLPKKKLNPVVIGATFLGNHYIVIYEIDRKEAENE